jgi:hypothetical protein
VERENGYRHPHCIIVTIKHSEEKSKQRILYEEHPCTAFELIEEALIQTHGLCCFLCVLIYAHECFFSCYAFALYMLCM